jgi:hypothetical protein
MEQEVLDTLFLGPSACSEAQFLAPGRGMKPAMTSGCRAGPPVYVGSLMGQYNNPTP